MSGFEVRGVPKSLQKDGWWLSNENGIEALSSGPGFATGAIRPEPFIALFALVVLADNLFWHHPVGLSLGIFGLALGLIIWLASKRRFMGRDGVVGVSLLGVAVLPVVEQMNTLSVLFLVAGVTAFTIWTVLWNTASIQHVLRGMMRFASVFPSFATFDLYTVSKEVAYGRDVGTLWHNLKRAWALPVIVGLVFVALLVAANPVMQSWFDVIFAFHWKPTSALGRLLFWVLMATAVWPFLCVNRIYSRLAAPASHQRQVSITPRFMGINPTSIANSLVVFNLIFAVQTGLDAMFLWNGFDLPAGVSHAVYAHRGAYPLVATALLAGVFAIISRPFTERNDFLRTLLVLWITQNFVLVLSSLYRLDLYVVSYGLTYLRIAAAIWMALVASGLALMAWQLWEGASNAWLFQKNAILLVSVLFVCCFVNFPYVIAATNLAQIDSGQRYRPIDTYYLCNLGPTAAGAIQTYNTEKNADFCSHKNFAQELDSDGWRDWGFRSWRVRGYICRKC